MGLYQTGFVCTSRSEEFFLFTVRLMFDATTNPQQITNKPPREEPSERMAGESMLWYRFVPSRRSSAGICLHRFVL